MSHPFLSDEWIEAARAVRQRHAGEAPAVPVTVRINQVVTDVPFGDGEVRSYIDTTSGILAMEIGELDDPDATVTTDYETAKMVFVTQDPAATMQAFMGGQIKVQGDLMKLLAMQAIVTTDEAARQLAAEIQAITD